MPVTGQGPPTGLGLESVITAYALTDLRLDLVTTAVSVTDLEIESVIAVDSNNQLETRVGYQSATRNRLRSRVGYSRALSVTPKPGIHPSPGKPARILAGNREDAAYCLCLIDASFAGVEVHPGGRFFLQGAAERVPELTQEIFGGAYAVVLGFLEQRHAAQV